jgi:hypothetical protein
MTGTIQKIVHLVLLSMCVCSGASAQHISFGTWASGDILLSKGTPEQLNFNDKTQLIIPGVSQSVTINLNDPQAAVLTVEGSEYLDVTVYVDGPPTVDLDASNRIPLAVRFAYSNLDPSDVINAKLQAVEVPTGFNTATFPIFRRTGGPPGPPPVPPSSGYTPPRKKAWLFIYGTLGPVGNVDAGLYEGMINVTVEYTKTN